MQLQRLEDVSDDRGPHHNYHEEGRDLFFRIKQPQCSFPCHDNNLPLRHLQLTWWPWLGGLQLRYKIQKQNFQLVGSKRIKTYWKMVLVADCSTALSISRCVSWTKNRHHVQQLQQEMLHDISVQGKAVQVSKHWSTWTYPISFMVA